MRIASLLERSLDHWERKINQWATLIPGIPSVPCVKQDQESEQGSSNGEGIELEKLVGLHHNELLTTTQMENQSCK